MKPTVPDDIKNLGDAIRWARKQARMTLRALAEKLDVSAPYLCDVEHGRRAMLDEKISAVAVATGVDSASLLARSDRFTSELAAWLRNHPGFLELVKDLQREERARCHCPWCRGVL